MKVANSASDLKFLARVSEMYGMLFKDTQFLYEKIGKNRKRLLGYANMYNKETTVIDIIEVVNTDNAAIEAALILDLSNPHIKAYNVQENMLTLKTSDRIEGISFTPTVISGEVRIAIDPKECPICVYKAKDFIRILNEFDEMSLTRIFRVSQHKDFEGEKYIVLVFGEGTKWETPKCL